jgi:hypothetical protein
VVFIYDMHLVLITFNIISGPRTLLPRSGVTRGARPRTTVPPAIVTATVPAAPVDAPKGMTVKGRETVIGIGKEIQGGGEAGLLKGGGVHHPIEGGTTK